MMVQNCGRSLFGIKKGTNLACCFTFHLHFFSSTVIIELSCTGWVTKIIRYNQWRVQRSEITYYNWMSEVTWLRFKCQGLNFQSFLFLRIFLRRREKKIFAVIGTWRFILPVTSSSNFPWRLRLRLACCTFVRNTWALCRKSRFINPIFSNKSSNTFCVIKFSYNG